ncbi:hypothetical protein TEA_020193 [Camellia sinensis var. sinensis]|uniref:Tocopherol cyclase n=1 Tax=Camellia sinensis var. sinensis TaxID=542762 RepID=A0A4S4DFJ5_CAMSN|nr:hypothetical protein TEA_020193 [Camellia sinensis var. sinensis]
MEANVYSLCNRSPRLGLPTPFLDSRAVNRVESLKPAQSFKQRWFRTPKKLRCRSNAPASAVSQSESLGSSTVEKTESVTPVYVPTPPNRDLRTPHSGYHFDGSTRKFFEGWYFKVSIPERRQSFCFMYSVENPAFRKKLTRLEEAQHGPRFTGVGAQILGAYDKYICQYTEESCNFWGSRHELTLGNTFIAQNGKKPPNKEVPPKEFNQRVMEGFQVTPLWHQGFIRDDGRYEGDTIGGDVATAYRTDYVDIVKTARWEYSTRPLYGWGNVASKQKSTAGWLAAFPVFEPHWQICMAGGLSTGRRKSSVGLVQPRKALESLGIAWAELSKDWLPRKILHFTLSIYLSLLSAPCSSYESEIEQWGGGGLRQLPGVTETFENAAMIGIHYEGIFYEFVPWNGVVDFEIAPWGHWCVSAENETHKVELEATTKDPGTTLRAPTSEAGLAPACKDTCFGDLRLKLWERTYNGSEGKIILDVTSNMAAVEVGGGPWFNTWKSKTSTPEIVSRVVGIPLDVERIFGRRKSEKKKEEEEEQEELEGHQLGEKEEEELEGPSTRGGAELVLGGRGKFPGEAELVLGGRSKFPGYSLLTRNG